MAAYFIFLVLKSGKNERMNAWSPLSSWEIKVGSPKLQSLTSSTKSLSGNTFPESNFNYTTPVLFEVCLKSILFLGIWNL